MQKYVNDIATVVGGSLAPLASASCAVYLTGTTTLASLYSDNGVTALTNPTTSSDTGRLQFYAADGRYDIVCSKTGFTTTTITDVLLEDPANAGDLLYLPDGTGAVTRTIQGKLRETVSVTDFGAVGDGVTDDTASLQTAMAATGDVNFFAGNFNIATFPSYSGSQVLEVESGASVTGSGASLLGLTNGGLAKRQLLQLNTTGGDSATQYIRRIANHSGGTAGWVSTALNVRTDVTGTGATNYEWAFLSVVHNYATAGQNVGGYLQGNKYSTGPTWGATIEVREKTGTTDPTTGTIAVEVDVFGNGSDNNNRRVGIDVTLGKNDVTDTTCEVAYGVRVVPTFNTFSQARVKRAFSVGNLEFDCGFDTSQGTQSATGVAFRMAAQQKFSLTATNDRYLTWNTGFFQLVGSGAGPALELSDAGALNITGSLSILGTQVVTARRTGYTNAMAGTANTATAYNTATITLVQLAERLKAIQDSLTTHGLIGP
jgi:hypothetical protein